MTRIKLYIGRDGVFTDPTLRNKTPFSGRNLYFHVVWPAVSEHIRSMPLSIENSVEEGFQRTEILQGLETEFFKEMY